MKFIVSSSLLLKNLQSISGVLNVNNTLPILDDFLFEIKEETLKITVSDLETTMNVTVPLTKSEEGIGNIAIPARILLETLKTFSDIPITFTVDEETLGVEIFTGQGKYKLVGHKAEEYPRTPVLEDTTSFDINSSILAKAISKTIFATSEDKLHEVMLGVFCELSPEDITLVATDAHKLVRYKRKDINAEETASFIFPKKPLNQLKNILSSEDIPVKIEYNKTNALFSFENINLICRLIDGKYPNYEAAIPVNNPNKLIVERVPFLNSIKRVAIFSNQSTRQIRLKIIGQELILSAEDMDYSNQARETLKCNYQGEDIEIGFNSRFLQEMIGNIDNDEVSIEMSAPNRAGIIKPVDNENKDEDILMLVMPIILS